MSPTPGATRNLAPSLVVVSMAAERMVAGGLRRTLTDLAMALGEARGPRLVFVPPLVANVAALGPEHAGLPLDAAVRAAARRRPARSLMVRMTYPEAPAYRRPWLVMHDRMHATLRAAFGELARRTASTVVGTVLLDHPRRHWEAWPDRGNLFHSAWCFGPDGEPHAVLRQRRPRWETVGDVRVDPSQGATRRLLDTAIPGWPVGVSWLPGQPPPDAPIVWAPRVWPAGQGGIPPAPLHAQGLLSKGARAAIRSCLAGVLGARLVDRSFVASAGSLKTIRRPAGAAYAFASAEVEPQSL